MPTTIIYDDRRDGTEWMFSIGQDIEFNNKLHKQMENDIETYGSRLGISQTNCSSYCMKDILVCEEFMKLNE